MRSCENCKYRYEEGWTGVALCMGYEQSGTEQECIERACCCDRYAEEGGKEERRELYRAVKYEVAECFADHGMTMAEMWNTVNGRTFGDSRFWYSMCMRDYTEHMAGR